MRTLINKITNKNQGIFLWTPMLAYHGAQGVETSMHIADDEHAHKKDLRI